MSRWSPTVLPQAPDRLRPMDIGSALENVANGISNRRDRKDRERKEAEARSRETAAIARSEADKQYARTRDDENFQRQEALDAEARRDRAVRREGDFLATRARAADEGFVDARQGKARAEGYGAMSAGGQAMGGAMGGAMSSIGDQLRRASEEGPRMTLTRPDDTTETMAFDPTMTREARDEQRQLRIDRARDAMKPPPEAPGAEHVARQEYDRKHKVGDFAPPRPTGGGGSGGGTALSKALATANVQVDNNRADLSRIEARAPKPPDFSDMPVPAEKTYPAAKVDSTARAKKFSADSNTYQGKLATAHQQAEKWNKTSDSLATELMRLSGGESVGGSQKISHQREIQAAQQEVNAALARASKNPETQREIRERYQQTVIEINQKYGVRPLPED